MELWQWGVAIAGLVLVVGVGDSMWRAYVASLPLRLSAAAARGELNGVPSATVRAMLGRGRALRDPRARATLMRPGHPPRDLRCLLPDTPVILGPWTITAYDSDLGVGAEGCILFEIEGVEGERRWEARASWPLDALQEGRFAGLQLAEGGLRWDLQRWDQLRPPVDADAG